MFRHLSSLWLGVLACIVSSVIGCDTPTESSDSSISQTRSELRNSWLPEDKEALAAWEKLGIYSYTGYFLPGNRIIINLLGEKNTHLGYLEITENNREKVINLIGDTFPKLELIEKTDIHEYQIADLLNGSKYTFDSQGKTDEKTKRFIKQNEKYLFVMLNALAHTIKEKQKFSVKAGNGTKADNDGIGQCKSELKIGCYGDYYRGNAVGVSQSWCCYYAKQDANYACSNSYCFGCCEFLECDSVCGIGSYGCSCGISGRECSSY